MPIIRLKDRIENLSQLHTSRFFTKNLKQPKSDLFKLFYKLKKKLQPVQNSKKLILECNQ